MKVCIYGAGAVGGCFGAWLAEAGADVTLIARGPHLAAIHDHGLTLIEGDRRTVLHPACTDDPRTVGVQDVVMVTVKAHSAPAIVDAMQPLLGPRTAVLTAANGIPWWYFYRAGGAFDGHRLDCVDPGGVQWAGIGPERAIGGVVYTAAEVVAPGVVKHVFGKGLILGEPDGAMSERCHALAEILAAAGIEAPVRPRIRDEIWLKLWGNLSFNPVSVLTQGTLADIAEDGETRAVVHAMMVEAQAVGEALGVEFAVDVEARIEMAAKVGAHRSSMLQDLLRGRPLEIDPIVTVIHEMGRMVGLATPTLDMVLGLVRQRARIAEREALAGAR